MCSGNESMFYRTSAVSFVTVPNETGDSVVVIAQIWLCMPNWLLTLSDLWCREKNGFYSQSIFTGHVYHTYPLNPRPHQQQCLSNIRLFLPKTATMSDEFFCEISSLRQSRNKLSKLGLVRLCRKDDISFDIVAKMATLLLKTAIMSKQHLTLSKQHSTLSIESFDL